MDENKISVRYAKALFSLAIEQKLLDDVKKDVDLIYQTLGTVPELKIILGNPVFKTSDKTSLFKEIFANKVNSITFSFLNLVLSNKRESYLEHISRNFLALYRKNSGYKSAVISSAYTLDSTIVEQFKQLIRNKFKTEVELTYNVNPNLIGGFILRVDDQQLDASVSTKLKGLKQKLIKSKQ
jgi:F-type H+-transporting ATPase subunit delta